MCKGELLRMRPLRKQLQNLENRMCVDKYERNEAGECRCDGVLLTVPTYVSPLVWFMTAPHASRRSSNGTVARHLVMVNAAYPARVGPPRFGCFRQTAKRNCFPTARAGVPGARRNHALSGFDMHVHVAPVREQQHHGAAQS